MGKGSSGGSAQPATQQVTTQTSLPAYAQPYYQDIMGRAQSLSQNAYTPYQGNFIAPFTGQQNAAFGAVNSLPNSYQPALNAAGQNFANASTIGTGIATGYQPGTITPQNVNVGTWNSQQANNYMNPYLQQSLAPQEQLLRQQTGIQLAAQDQGAAQQGAFGGTRQGVMDALTNQGSNLAMANLIGQGYNSAWSQAQQQYNADRAAQEQAALANQQAGLQGQTATEQARQAAANIGLAGANTALQAGQGQTWLGSTGESTALGNINALQQAGAIQQNQNQAGLNTQYQQFLNQLQWPYQQLSWETGLMSGVPTGLNAAQTQFQNPNPLSQMLGLGIAGAGLYGALR